MTAILKAIARSVTSKVEMRLFQEYGAVFVTEATPPPTLIFPDSAAVRSFQARLSTRKALFGDHEIELQAKALDALSAAASEAEAQGFLITARAADSGRRSYEDTVTLWNRNVTRGLEKWEAEGRMSPDRARSIRELPPVEQVPVILDIEESEQLYFGTFFNRSILYSVAAPGASQHLSMLAFDVAQYEDEAVERVLARHGWFRTVINDLPHFTFLGHSQDALAAQGLKQVAHQYADKTYRFWIADLESLV